MLRLELVTAPTVEPLTLEEAKDHLRESGDPIPQDTEIESRIQAARETIENDTGRALIQQTWRLYLDRFPRCRVRPDNSYDPGFIDLPKVPVASVTSVKYIDTVGVEQTLVAGTDYVTLLAGNARHIRPVYGVPWPTPRDEPDAVRVVFVCGYGATAESVPEALRNAMRLLIGELYEHREASIVGTIVAAHPALDRLMSPYRIRQVA